jgi:acyl-CoA thioester hydrolase
VNRLRERWTNAGTEDSSRIRDGFEWPVRVYYEDTDAGGVVYYANYLKFLERARTERLRAAGFEQDELRRSDGLLFAVKAVEIDYLRPARFNDALLVTADYDAVKFASVSFDQKVYRAAEPQQLLCRARVRVVCLSADELTPRPIPEYLLQRIKDDA